MFVDEHRRTSTNRSLPQGQPTTNNDEHRRTTTNIDEQFFFSPPRRTSTNILFVCTLCLGGGVGLEKLSVFLGNCVPKHSQTMANPSNTPKHKCRFRQLRLQNAPFILYLCALCIFFLFALILSLFWIFVHCACLLGVYKRCPQQRPNVVLMHALCILSCLSSKAEKK